MRLPQLSSSDGPGGGGNVNTIGPSASADDIATFLGEDADDDVIEDGNKGKKEKKESIEDIELKEDDDKDTLDLKEKKKEDKNEEDEDEQKEDDKHGEEDEEVEINAPPRKKELLAAYPELFKKFPFVEKMLYRDKQYQELFGSFDDAKEASEKVKSYEHFEDLLSVGNTEEVLKTIKDSDSKIFDKVVDNYLITLHKIDKDAYFEVVGNVGKRFIAEMVSESKNSDNEELKQAALILNQFLFGKSTYEPIKTRVTVDKDKDTESAKLEQERQELARERFDTARIELQGRADNILRNTINEYIDPRDVMTGYIKKNAIKDAMNYLTESLGSDESLKRNLDRLWKAAHEAKYSRESLDKIQSAYLGRAKALAPSAIKKARSEALKDITPRDRKEEREESSERSEREEETPRRRTISPGRPSSQKKTEKMEKGESVLDFLSRD